MGHLDIDEFLLELHRLFANTKTSGNVSITMKKFSGAGTQKRDKAAMASEPEEGPKTLIRAATSKKKISTLVSAKNLAKFHSSYTNILKANMDSLKKPKRTKTTKPKATQ
eukprot:Colp12_sorted_trinity150504_noHs@1383